MYIKQVHLEIEQGLQQVGVFAYSDFQPEEIDLAIDRQVLTLIRSAFFPIRTGPNRLDEIQGVLERLQTLKVIDTVLTNGEPLEDSIDFSLPEDYVYLVRDSTLISWRNRKELLDECDKIKPNIRYYIERGSVLYNGEIYKKGNTFLGIDNIDSYSPFEDSSISIMPKRRVFNRLTKSQDINEVLDNALTTTSPRSPVSEEWNNKLRVYFNKFFVDSVIISYIRKPDKVNINFQRFTSSTSLQPNTRYFVTTGSISYNGTDYTRGEEFQTAIGVTNFTGTGIVKVVGDGDLNFPDVVCQEIIDSVIRELSIISEQNQQKIVNLSQKNNVPS